jgi:hypothetical protein
MLEWLVGLAFVIILGVSFLPEMLKDILFLKRNRWDISKQRESNMYDGFLKIDKNKLTMKSRFLFAYPLVLFLLVRISVELF